MTSPAPPDRIGSPSQVCSVTFRTLSGPMSATLRVADEAEGQIEICEEVLDDLTHADLTRDGKSVAIRSADQDGLRTAGLAP
jgi:hypothetical protein